MIEEALQPLMKYLTKPDVVELQVTSPGSIWVETPKTGLTLHDDPALNLEYFLRLGRILSNTSKITNYDKRPYLALSLPGGHRMQLCVGNTVKSGVAMSIRVWKPRTFHLKDYGLTADQMALFEEAIAKSHNILISGGMFSGKTTFTNALLELVPTSARVISQEDTPELDLTHIPNRTEFLVNRLATSEDIDNTEVLKAMMRLRPDRLIVGELSPDNTFLLARILNMGHGGTIATLHADSPELAFEALTLNCELAGFPTEASGRIFRKNIHLVAQIARDPKTYKRVITEIWKNPNGQN